MNVKMKRIVRSNVSSSTACFPIDRCEMTSCKLLYSALSFVDNSVKNNLARSEMRLSGSSRHLAISPSCPLTLIIPLRIKCVRTMSVFFLTGASESAKPWYKLSEFFRQRRHKFATYIIDE